MPIFCFFCARSLREAVRYIALIYVAITLYDLFWAVYHLTLNYTHWIYYVSLVVCLISLPFHGILFMGSQQERRDYVYWWIGFTLVVTFPFLVLWLAICIFEFSIWCIFVNLISLAFRAYMWFEVRKYHAELGLQPATGPQGSVPTGVQKPAAETHRGAGLV